MDGSTPGLPAYREAQRSALDPNIPRLQLVVAFDVALQLSMSGFDLAKS